MWRGAGKCEGGLSLQSVKHKGASQGWRGAQQGAPGNGAEQELVEGQTLLGHSSEGNSLTVQMAETGSFLYWLPARPPAKGKLFPGVGIQRYLYAIKYICYSYNYNNYNGAL